MEASVVVAPEPPPQEAVATYDGQAEATRSGEELFQWSRYVHVGRGASECEHGQDGKCDRKPSPLPDGGMEGHFHAWVCLPNTFQIRDIGDKARAAKARKSRALRDPESDSYAVLEEDLAELSRDGMDKIIAAASEAEVEKRLPEIIDGLKDDERFAHQEQDAEEFRRLEALSEDDRDAEEYDRLKAQMLAYSEHFDAVIAEQERRERESLARTPEQALEIERRSRIEHISIEAYLHTYYTWSVYVGTRKPVADGLPLVRSFGGPEELRLAPPEVVVVLRETIKDLEERTTVRSDAAGNS
jgi:hypothetical protein